MEIISFLPRCSPIANCYEREHAGFKQVGTVFYIVEGDVTLHKTPYVLRPALCCVPTALLDRKQRTPGIWSQSVGGGVCQRQLHQRIHPRTQAHWFRRPPLIFLPCCFQLSLSTTWTNQSLMDKKWLVCLLSLVLLPIFPLTTYQTSPIGLAEWLAPPSGV
jgi:hypothetical protein